MASDNTGFVKVSVNFLKCLNLDITDILLHMGHSSLHHAGEADCFICAVVSKCPVD